MTFPSAADVPRNWDRYLVGAWASSLIFYVLWFQFGLPASNADCCVVASAHVVCLPLISRRMTPAALLGICFATNGLAIGFELIDLVFDILVVRDLPVHDGQSSISARRIAWLYYNTMLNSKHVNFGIAIILMVGQFAIPASIMRSSLQVLGSWMTLFAMMVAGNGAYLLIVIPRYNFIRASVIFEESFFDGWSAVILAHLWLLFCQGVAMVVLCHIARPCLEHQRIRPKACS
eukprot:TRINITY_DN56899_c0_g1_i1.p1 TRINITY_DN56899_c0_g1~~TRINITY_DN56899_c0_g1_i1.p1  ORF type:complete len:233 (-),score=8.56 TRINITY_DN56899_c0_g1_i1:93-791(-)